MRRESDHTTRLDCRGEAAVGKLTVLEREKTCPSAAVFSEGATFEWTAISDGLMGVPTYVRTLARANPDMPIFVESIICAVSAVQDDPLRISEWVSLKWLREGIAWPGSPFGKMRSSFVSIRGFADLFNQYDESKLVFVEPYLVLPSVFTHQTALTRTTSELFPCEMALIIRARALWCLGEQLD